jgi:flagellar biogenesis protein FliO
MNTARLTPLRIVLLSTLVVSAATVAYADGAQSARPQQEGLPLGEPAVPAVGPTNTAETKPDGLVLNPARYEILRVGFALAVVLGLMLVARGVARRFSGPLVGGGRPSGVIEVLGRYPIGRAQQLVLLRMVGRVVLLHQSRAGVTTISEITDPDEVATVLARVHTAARSGPAGRFHGFLTRATGTAPAEREARNGKVVVDLTRRGRRRTAREASA